MYCYYELITKMTSPVVVRPDGVVMTIPQLAHGVITSTDYLVTWIQLGEYARTALTTNIITDVDVAIGGLVEHTQSYTMLPSDTVELLVYLYHVLTDNTSCYLPLQSLTGDHTVTLPHDVMTIIASNCDVDTRLLLQQSTNMALPYWLCIIPIYPVVACQLVRAEYQQWSNDVRQYVLNVMLKYYTPHYHQRENYYRALPGDWQLLIKYAAMHHDNIQYIRHMVCNDNGALCVMNDDCDSEIDYMEQHRFEDRIMTWFKILDNTIPHDISLHRCQLIASLPQLPAYLRPHTTLPAWLYDMIDHGPTMHPEFLSHDDVKLVIVAADIYSWDITTIPCLQEHLQSFTASYQYLPFANICQQHQHGDIAIVHSLT